MEWIVMGTVVAGMAAACAWMWFDVTRFYRRINRWREQVRRKP